MDEDRFGRRAHPGLPAMRTHESAPETPATGIQVGRIGSKLSTTCGLPGLLRPPVRWHQDGAHLELGSYLRHGESHARILDQPARRRGRGSLRRSGAAGTCGIDRAVRIDKYRRVACRPASPNPPGRSSSHERLSWLTRAIGMSRLSGMTARSKRLVSSSRSRRPGIG